jgi:hypothetical protein
VAEDPLDQLEVGQVVLDVEDGEVGPGRRGRLGGGRLLLELALGVGDRGLGQGQLDPEGAALPDGGGQLQGAAHGLGQALGQG